MGENNAPSRLRSRETQTLVEQGRARGFVTSDDILQMVPNPEERLDQVEDMLDELREARVPVVDEAAGGAQLWEDGPPALAPDEPEVELEPIADYEHEGIDDPVRMYLREIGRVYMLTGEDERRLAKRMEEGKVIKEVREALQNQ